MNPGVHLVTIAFSIEKQRPEHDEPYMDAIRAEIKRIASELTVIAATLKSVQEEQSDIQSNIEDLYQRRTAVSRALEEKNHVIQDYRTGLQRYKDYTTFQTGIDFVNSQLAILGEKKVSELQRKKNLPLFYVKKEIEEVVGMLLQWKKAMPRKMMIYWRKRWRENLKKLHKMKISIFHQGCFHV